MENYVFYETCKHVGFENNDIGQRLPKEQTAHLNECKRKIELNRGICCWALRNIIH